MKPAVAVMNYKDYLNESSVHGYLNNSDKHPSERTGFTKRRETINGNTASGSIIL